MRLGDAFAREYPAANHGLTLAVTSLRDDVAGPARAALLIMFAAVACLLLIACANVSGLILVRAAARSRELAIRRAIGASRGRLVGQMLTESAVLAAAGGMCALLFSSWVLDAFVWLAPAGIPRLEDVHLDFRVAAFAIAVATAAGLLFGLVPALQVHRRVEQDALRSGGRGMVSGANRRTRHALVVVEVALSTMLLVGGSLLIQSFVRLSRVDTGLRPAAAVAVDRIELPGRAQSRSGAFFDQLLARLRDAPGIDAAGATIGVPLDPRGRFFVDDSTFCRPPPIGAGRSAAVGRAARRIRRLLRRGRHSLETWPRIRCPRSERCARRCRHQRGDGEALLAKRGSDRPDADARSHDSAGPDGHAAGRRHRWQRPPFRSGPAVGAADVHPHLQMPWPSMALVLRTSLPIERVNAIVREAVHGLDATLPVPPARRMDQVMSDALGQPRFRAWLVGLFAGAALLLAMVGLYGTIAFMVHQRTRELGLRMALGASPQQTMRLVLSFGLKLAGAGAVIGLISAVAATRVLATMLFGVGPTDPATFFVAPLSVVVVAGVACYLPARRIRRIEAWKALNDELG